MRILWPVKSLSEFMGNGYGELISALSSNLHLFPAVLKNFNGFILQNAMKLTQTPFCGKRKFKQLLAAQEARWFRKIWLQKSSSTVSLKHSLLFPFLFPLNILLTNFFPLGNKELLVLHPMWQELLKFYEKRKCVVNESAWPVSWGHINFNYSTIILRIIQDGLSDFE